MLSATYYTTTNTDLALVASLFVVLLARARLIRRQRRRAVFSYTPKFFKCEPGVDYHVKIISSPHVPLNRIYWFDEGDGQRIHDAFEEAFSHEPSLSVKKVGMLGLIEMRDWPFDWTLDAPEFV